MRAWSKSEGSESEWEDYWSLWEKPKTNGPISHQNKLTQPHNSNCIAVKVELKQNQTEAIVGFKGH